MENEEIIIRKAQQGNQQAFRILVEKYQLLIYSICYNVVKDSQHAENIAQETFLQVFRSLPNYEYKGFKTWIGRIALNKAIDYQRKATELKKREVEYIDDVELIVATDGQNMEDELGRKEDIKKIGELCNQLPDIYRTILRKYYIKEMCYADIALEEGISVKTVESRLYRARKLLKEKWEEDAW